MSREFPGERRIRPAIVSHDAGAILPRDTLYPTLTIASLVPQRTTGIVVMAATVHNQNAELVLSGEQKFLLRK